MKFAYTITAVILVTVGLYIAYGVHERSQNEAVHKSLVLAYSSKYARCMRGMSAINVSEVEASARCYENN